MDRSIGRDDIFTLCIPPGATQFVTLPLNPRSDITYIVKDYGGTANINNIIVFAPNGFTIEGAASKTISTAYGVLSFRIYPSIPTYYLI